MIVSRIQVSYTQYYRLAGKVMGKTILLLVIVLTLTTLLFIFAGFLIGPQWKMVA